MKRLIIVSACAIALAIAQNLIAGREALPSGKEMKEIAPAPPPECNGTGFYVGGIGGLVGGGLEFAFNCHWSIKGEYDHIFFGDDEENVVERGPGGFSAITTFHAHDADRDMIVGGINLKF